MADSSSGMGPKKGTVYGGPAPKTEGTVYSGPAPGGTVYDPSRNKAGSRSRRPTTPEEAKKLGNVFFAIAAFSLINTGIIIFGGRIALSIGLGITRGFDAAILKGGPIAPVLIINGMAALIFVVLGMFARSGSAVAFLLGMLLYGAETVILWQDGPSRHIPSLFIHVVFVFGMFAGFRALWRK
jgi:hypothetical protein